MLAQLLIAEGVETDKTGTAEEEEPDVGEEGQAAGVEVEMEEALVQREFVSRAVSQDIIPGNVRKRAEEVVVDGAEVEAQDEVAEGVAVAQQEALRSATSVAKRDTSPKTVLPCRSLVAMAVEVAGTTTAAKR